MDGLGVAQIIIGAVLFIIAIVVICAWVFFPMIVVNRLNTLIEIGEKNGDALQSLLAQSREQKAIRVDPAVLPQGDGSASCECFHCGQNISFEKANYDPNNPVIDCPNCGKKTKLFIKYPVANM